MQSTFLSSVSPQLHHYSLELESNSSSFSLRNSLLWDPLEKGRATTTDEAAIRQWDVNTLQQTVEVKGGELDKFSSGSPVPTKGNQFAVACNDAVKFFDLSTGKCVYRPSSPIFE
jgi:WD40 repeat protein